MEIRHLKLVETVAREGSLTKAAEKLFLTQSALSHQLREIETKYETPLFHRINKKMILTHVGERILQTAKVILGEITRTENDIKSYVSGDTGVVRLSTECYTCYHWLPGVLLSYHRHFPNVEVKIIAEATRRPLQFLLEGKLDLAIICLMVEEEIGDKNISVEPLMADELMLVVRRDHPLSRREYVKARDFRNENLIVYTAPNELLDIFQRLLVPNGVTPKKTIKMQLTEAIIEMVKAGLGITAMARWAVAPYLESSDLVAVPITKPGLRRTWYGATIKEKNSPHYLTSFMKHLSAHSIG